MARKERIGFPFGKTADSLTRKDIQIYLDENYDAIKAIVEKHFFILDSKRINGTLGFYISAEPGKLDGAYDSVRNEVKGMGLLVTLLRERGELALYIFKAPIPKKKSVKVNILLFIATLATTIWAGTLMWASYSGYNSGLEGEIGTLLEIFEVLLHPQLVLFGALSFALPILLILGLHEAGHYIASKRNNVDASLPYFIPIPPVIGILGTFGAFISIKEPMPSKKALIQIGAAGPIVGFLVAIPVTIVGFMLSQANPGAPIHVDSLQAMILGEPLIYKFISGFFSLSDENILHPTAFAGWVGLLVTAFNLLPAGQLDGGHIARALFGAKGRYFSYASIVALLIMGLWYPGWFIFAFLILLLGVRHPPPLNDISPLRIKEKIIGAVCIAILVLCFIPIPMTVVSLGPRRPELTLTTADDCLSTDIGGNMTFSLLANNSGNRDGNFQFIVSVEYEHFEEVNITLLRSWDVNIAYESTPGNVGEIELDFARFPNTNEIARLEIRIPERSYSWINLSVHANDTLPFNSELKMNITAFEKEHAQARDHQVVCARVSSLELFSPDSARVVLAKGNIPNIASFLVTATNVGQYNDTYTLTLDHPADWDAWINTSYSIDVAPHESVSFYLRALPPLYPAENMTAFVVLRARSQRNTGLYEQIQFKVSMEKE